MYESPIKTRYIKAEEAEERIVALWRKEKGAYADVFNTAIDACQTIILDMYDNSSQDVVPVVRCKDCKFFRRYGFRLEYADCIKFDFYDTTEDGYCCWAERREDDSK